MLNVLAIVVGVVAVATRFVGVLFPGFGKKLLKLLLEERGVALFGMVYAAALGALFIWGFRCEFAADTAYWQAYVLLVLGIVLTLMALLFLASPRSLFGLLTWISDLTPASLRLLFLVGVIVGVALILLGVSMA
jgi:hypothetical protein